MADAKPEILYTGFTASGLLYSPVPSLDPNNTLYKPVFDMPTSVITAIAVGWNYSDAIDAFIAAHELLTEDTYHTGRNKVKAALNILSGTQMLIFSCNFGLTDFGSAALAGATTLASPAFAFAMLCDLINLSIDLVYAAKETEFEGWLEEKLLELRHLNKRVEEQKAKHKHDKTEIEGKIAQLENLITARSRVYYNDGYYHCKNNTKDMRKDAIENIFKHEQENSKSGTNISKYLSEAQLFEKPTDSDRLLDNQTQKQLDEKFSKIRKNWAFKCISFTGMTLLAVASFITCPPLVITGTILVTVVSIYYAQKHFKKLRPEMKSGEQQVSVVKSSIFSPIIDTTTYHEQGLWSDCGKLKLK
jgi:hypothetical protein